MTTKDTVKSPQAVDEMAKTLKPSTSETRFKEIDIMFMSEWQEHLDPTSSRLDEYIFGEIKRLEANGFAVVSSILAMKENFPKTRALMVLTSEPQFKKHTNYIKLAVLPDVELPIHDYNGALVPEGKRGKVLAAKSGLHSHMNTALSNTLELTKDPAKALKRDSLYLGRKFAVHQQKAQKVYGYQYAPYVIVEISREPTEVSYEEGINILNRYGFDISSKEKLWFVKECY